MNILSDKAVFKIKRDSVGDCLLAVRMCRLFIFPYWLSLIDSPVHFMECLGFIKDWCCARNIGKAVIYDHEGANKKMTIKYRRYKGEVLNELEQ